MNPGWSLDLIPCSECVHDRMVAHDARGGIMGRYPELAKPRTTFKIPNVSLLTAALVGLLLLALGAPSARAMTVVDSSIQSRTGLDDLDVTTDMPTGSAPLMGTTSVATRGNTSSVDWALLDDALSFDFAHSRSSGLDEVVSTEVSVDFTVPTDRTYALSGLYSVLDASGRFTSLSVGLRWLRGPQDTVNLFNNGQQSQSTPNETFVVGEAGGDLSNGLGGSLTGLLVGGETYQLRFQIGLQNFPAPAGDAATASGNILLSLTPIPEPTTAVLVGLGLIGLAATTRRRR
jgi:hypothetical protein